MEDFLSTFWGIALVLISIISIVVQKKKAAAEKQPINPPQEHATPQEHAAQQEPSVSARKRNTPRRRDTTADFTQYTAAPTSTLSDTLRAANTASEAVLEDNTGESLNNDEPSETQEIAAGFDLRQAVIYSEILKPKFDE